MKIVGKNLAMWSGIDAAWDSSSRGKPSSLRAMVLLQQETS